jgi:Pyridoxal-phosphate dependent enzyme
MKLVNASRSRVACDRSRGGQFSGRRRRDSAVALHRVTTTSGAIHPDDVVAPHKLLRDVVSETPVLHSWVLSEAVGGPVYLKCENLQRAGSFKIRGLLQDR